MRITLILRDNLLKKAMKLAGIQEKTVLVHAGLEALIAMKARERLATLGGCEPRLRQRRLKKILEHAGEYDFTPLIAKRRRHER